MVDGGRTPVGRTAALPARKQLQELRVGDPEIDEPEAAVVLVERIISAKPSRSR